MANKITVWGTQQAVWGSDLKVTRYFKTKAERDSYFAELDYIDKLRARKVDESDLFPARDNSGRIIPGAYALCVAD